VLLANQVPIVSFPPAELIKEGTASIALGEGPQIVLAFSDPGGLGSLQLIRFNKATGALFQTHLKRDKTDVCSGSVLELHLVGNFTLVSTHISPSAECLLVLDAKFELLQTLYGFRPRQVAPNQIVLIEDMIHFAPVHPERLQLGDLSRRTTLELYPPAGDVLREQFSQQHAKHMPPPQTCQRMNDPCSPALFDEDIRTIFADGNGRFALLVDQSASHVTLEDQQADLVLSQTVLYVYQRAQSGWLYCEEKLDNSEAVQLASLLARSAQTVASRCMPHLPVVPDMSTAAQNPFLTLHP
jgi:hypothetical protein